MFYNNVMAIQHETLTNRTTSNEMRPVLKLCLLLFVLSNNHSHVHYIQNILILIILGVRTCLTYSEFIALPTDSSINFILALLISYQFFIGGAGAAYVVLTIFIINKI